MIHYRALIFITCLLVFMSSITFAQKKKTLKEYDIKSITETITNIENGKSYTTKESSITLYKNGNPIIEIKYNKDGSIKKKTITKYDEKKNRIEEIDYDGAGKIVSKQTYIYNSKGDRSIDMEYDANNVLVKKEVYSYDNKGFKTEKKVYNGNTILLKTHKYTFEKNKE